jgi:hypothetical protein
MGPAVTAELLKNSMYQSKGPFHASILIQLGEECQFESYIPYLENPVKFLKTKLMESIENYCLKQGRATMTILLEREANKIKEQIFTAISMANKLTKAENGKLTFWIQKFVEYCSTLAITKGMFAVAAIDEDLKDVDVFEAKVRVNVENFLETLVKRGVDQATFQKWDPSPHDLLFTSMFGCQKLCPFCKSLCDQTVQKHPCSHSTRIHRPQALAGTRNIETRILVTKVCTAEVAGGGTFRNSDTSGIWHPYKDYRSINDYYKSWAIPPDPSFEASTYWQWFMATFSRELAEHFDAKQPDIPVAWKNRTFREAKEQLQLEYNI